MSNPVKKNTPLVTHIFTADPSAHVFNGSIFIYPSHDIDHNLPSNDNGDQYNMEDYHVLEMKDLNSPCIDHGEVLHMRDIPWVSQQLWAPDCVYKNGKYYLFFPARDKEGIFRLGVAISEKPEGPFTPEKDFVKGSYSIDPAVFTDDDGQTYVYFGGLWGGQLEKWQTGTFTPDAASPAPTAPAIGPRVAKMADDLLQFDGDIQEISILDASGAPILAQEEDRRFFEGPWMHKYNGLYYLSYSTGSTHYLVYATSTSPVGPFTYRGRLLEPVLGWTTHHSIVEFEGKWYMFYHDASLSGGVDHKRSVKFTEIFYNADGTIQKVDIDK